MTVRFKWRPYSKASGLFLPTLLFLASLPWRTRLSPKFVLIAPHEWKLHFVFIYLFILIMIWYYFYLCEYELSVAIASSRRRRRWLHGTMLWELYNVLMITVAQHDQCSRRVALPPLDVPTRRHVFVQSPLGNIHQCCIQNFTNLGEYSPTIFNSHLAYKDACLQRPAGLARQAATGEKRYWSDISNRVGQKLALVVLRG